jgi:23S rRNA (pseudouridine1915-N3)-methyltransferase
MKINLIWVGKTKEPFILEGIGKYLKLIKNYADVSITEIKEEKSRDIQVMLKKEGERISRLKRPYILLDEKGRDFTSFAFAAFIRDSKTPLTFIMGGAFGVSEEIKEKAQFSLSLSPMTLTHEMARLVFLEQVYRAFTIIQKRGYHH